MILAIAINFVELLDHINFILITQLEFLFSIKTHTCSPTIAKLLNIFNYIAIEMLLHKHKLHI
jgi:hypothetical protein